jgi:hypothetical protein
VGYENVVTWYETPCAGYEMRSERYENEISMKLAVHRQRYEKLCTVRKQTQRYEKHLHDMKNGYEKNFKGMKVFSKV